MVRRVVVAAWLVFAFLLSSKNASAYPPLPTTKTLILNQRDSKSLLNRMKVPVQQEIHRGARLNTKRFATSDGAVRIDCGHYHLPQQGYPIVCSVTLDPAKSFAGVSVIQPGYVPKSMVFRVLAKKDVANMLQNMVHTAGAFYSSESMIVTDQKKSLNVPQFYFNCPRDWVFDVVACDGHIIIR